MENMQCEQCEQCEECEGGGDLVEDRQSGDVICRNCGLVADSRIMDMECEYIYNNENANCFPSINKIIGKDDDGNTDILNSHTLSSLNEIGKLCGQASLPTFIQEEAYRIFHKVKTIKRKSNNSMYATVIFIACRTTGFPRSKNEIINGIPDVSMKDFSKYYKKCILEVGTTVSFQTKPSEFMVRFCSKLGLNNSEILLCQNIATKCVSEEIAENHTPVALAASIVYFITLLPNVSKRIKLSSIAEVTNVANVTIRSIYKGLKLIEDKLVTL